MFEPVPAYVSGIGIAVVVALVAFLRLAHAGGEAAWTRVQRDDARSFDVVVRHESAASRKVSTSLVS